MTEPSALAFALTSPVNIRRSWSASRICAQPENTKVPKRPRRPNNLKRNSRHQQEWRIHGVEISWKVFEGLTKAHLVDTLASQLSRKLGKKEEFIIEELLGSPTPEKRDEIALALRSGDAIPVPNLRLVRKSFDCRFQKEPRFSLVFDLTCHSKTFSKHLIGKKKQNVLEPILSAQEEIPLSTVGGLTQHKRRVVVVGAGPAGLFAALKLVKLGAAVTLIERGEDVRKRGADIGALLNRKLLNEESNYCFGEGGAGTWSDGKLTTGIGKNSSNVREVLETLVEHGAPAGILTDGKPHLGTDRLVGIIRALRTTLEDLGCAIRFGTRLEDIELDVSHSVSAVVVRKDDTTSRVEADAVVLAVGHSAIDIYEMLLHRGVDMEAKPYALGVRIEHPQELINSIQYGTNLADHVNLRLQKTLTTIPVADYRVAASRLAVPSRSNVSEPELKSAWSFCMCPGGQIVPTSVSKTHLSINGMSFSKRASPWANSGLVVNVGEEEFGDYRDAGALSGIKFQLEIERQACIMGGGNLVVPVQSAMDFLDGKITPDDRVPKSSYRLGVRSSPVHELFPPHITSALRQSLEKFEKSLPGYLSDQALIHAVESRTSAPVRVVRGEQCESTNTAGLFLAGEGSGHAGGIVSAAVDGAKVAVGVVSSLSSSVQ